MSELSDGAIGALRSVLGAENAAVWVYGLSTAYVTDGPLKSAVGDAYDEHRAHRDTAEAALRGAGTTAPPAAPAYALPAPVTDQGSALRALLTAEHDCQVGWRSVLENTDDAGLRRTALDGLTTSTTRATRWSLALGQPAPDPFPGRG